MSRILVSFNNTYQSPGYPSLGLFDTERWVLQFLELPVDIPQTGFLGLAVSSGYVYAGLQYAFDATTAYRIPPEIGHQYSRDGVLESLNPCSLLVFDRKNFKLVNHYPFRLVKDVHSFLLKEEEGIMYIVSTGSDEVIRIRLDGKDVTDESVFWRPEANGPKEDIHHLNSICLWEGDLLVSGFGKKEMPDDWNTAKDGFIYNITKGKYLIRGLQQPHSIAVIGNELAYCESKEKRVRFVDNDKVIEVEGYSRGLCEVEGHIYVGTSAKRQKSKSTGKQNKDTTLSSIGCTIRRVSVNNPDEYKLLRLEDMAHEIYELVPVENTFEWPVLPPINYKQQFEAAWSNQRSLAIEEINSALDGYGRLIIADDNALGFSSADFPGKKLSSFIQRDGYYWGPPENDEIALLELSSLLESNNRAAFAILWPSFWMLETFPGFKKYLDTQLTCIFKNHRVIIYARV